MGLRSVEAQECLAVFLDDRGCLGIVAGLSVADASAFEDHLVCFALQLPRFDRERRHVDGTGLAFDLQFDSHPLRRIDRIGHGPFAYGFRIRCVRGDLSRRSDFRHFPQIGDRNQVADEQAVRIRLVRFVERERVRVVSREGPSP